MILGYRCSLCEREYSLEEITYTCPPTAATWT